MNQIPLSQFYLNMNQPENWGEIPPNEIETSIVSFAAGAVLDAVLKRISELSEQLYDKQRLNEELWAEFDNLFSLSSQQERLYVLSKIQAYTLEMQTLEVAQKIKEQEVAKARELSEEERQQVADEVGLQQDKTVQNVASVLTNENIDPKTDELLNKARIFLTQEYKRFVKNLHPDSNQGEMSQDNKVLYEKANEFNNLFRSLYRTRDIEGLERLVELIQQGNNIVEAYELYSNKFDQENIKSLEAQIRNIDKDNALLSLYLANIMSSSLNDKIDFDTYYHQLMTQIETEKGKLSLLDCQLKEAQTLALVNLERLYTMDLTATNNEITPRTFIPATSLDEMRERLAKLKKAEFDFNQYGQHTLATQNGMDLILEQIFSSNPIDPNSMEYWIILQDQSGKHLVRYKSLYLGMHLTKFKLKKYEPYDLDAQRMMFQPPSYKPYIHIGYFQERTKSIGESPVSKPKFDIHDDALVTLGLDTPGIYTEGDPREDGEKMQLPSAGRNTTKNFFDDQYWVGEFNKLASQLFDHGFEL